MPLLTDIQTDVLVRISKETGIPLTLKGSDIPRIKQIIYSNPATIIIWKDMTKTVVKCTEKDTYNPTTGLALCVMKKVYGTKEYKRILKEHLPHEDD